MLPSKERVLKTNDGFKELVLTCFGSCVRQEHSRLYHDYVKEQESQAQGLSEGMEGFFVMPDHEKRLFDWILKQLKSNEIINPQSAKQAKPHHIEAVLAMFDDSESDDLIYIEIPEGKEVDLNNLVDWDKSKSIIMNKILESEFLYGLAF
jgi:hypothetical protein